MHNDHNDIAKREFQDHSTAKRVFSDAVVLAALRKQYPNVHLTLISSSNCDLRSYAAAGFFNLVPDVVEEAIKRRQYNAPVRRLDGKKGSLQDEVIFAKYTFTYQDHEMTMYYVAGRDGSNVFTNTQFVLGANAAVVDELILAVAEWANELHQEIWVFDGGHWRKSTELYKSVQKASWEDVILDPATKEAIRDDVMQFFASRKRYGKLRVPWKRGVIYHGPPGNGKTVSIKATIKTLDDLPDRVPTLYVRSLRSNAGPEASVSRIFQMARRTAPCLLVFEDLDSLITDQVRSYFLNELDGLESNDGIFIVGSTNHFDRLDVAISERPSRFDRKFNFPKPSFEERIAYCNYWRAKFSDTDEDNEIDFPARLSWEIAKLTDDWSFAFLQESFVAALLSIAGKNLGKPGPQVGVGEGAVLPKEETQKRGKDEGEAEEAAAKDKEESPQTVMKDELNNCLLWQEMKKQISALQLDAQHGRAAAAGTNKDTFPLGIDGGEQRTVVSMGNMRPMRVQRAVAVAGPGFG